MISLLVQLLFIFIVVAAGAYVGCCMANGRFELLSPRVFTKRLKSAARRKD